MNVEGGGRCRGLVAVEESVLRAEMPRRALEDTQNGPWRNEVIQI